MSVRNFKDMASDPVLTEYCMVHGYSITWNRWHDSILFTREDGTEFVPMASVTANVVYDTIKDHTTDESTDPLEVYLDPAPPQDPDVLL